MIINNQPQATVVIPTYNRPSYLQHCLRCLYLQASLCASFEVIVVTDGPDPATEKAVDAFMNIPYMPLRLLSLPFKKGPAAARNAGWESANSELIIFTDDDCLPANGFVVAYINAFRQSGDPMAAFTGKLIVPITATPTDYEKNTSLLASAEFVTANCACSKQALSAVSGFDEAFTMAWREDSDLQFKLMNQHILPAKVDNAVVVHPVRKANWGISLKEQKKAMFNALLLKKHPQLFREKIYRGPLWNYYAINISLLATAFFLLISKPMPAAIAFITWIILILVFAGRRLQKTRRTPAHIAEMIATSVAIPLLSVYWTLYGAWRYKTFLI
jgi:glycosyltransferase involved in cell wall biosynthesis